MKVECKVKPGARENSVHYENDVLVVKLCAKPEHGKANLELLKLLKKEFGWNARILKGITSRNKILEIGD